MKGSFLFLFLLFTCFSLAAQNPINKPGAYLADPAAHVWKDGKLYVYGSSDESKSSSSSWSYNVYSTSDLKTWTVTENIFNSKGPNDQVSYNDAKLWAPDVQFKNGTYYLYYCQPDLKHIEGVATSKNPLGPFADAQGIELNGNNQIDPCVFMDDDGQAYYIWGQFQAKIAKLKPNMKDIDWTTLNNQVVTEKDHFFHEGAYMIKRNGIYYMLYADMSRAGMPTSIGYSTSKSPLGPFKYGGVIIDNDHADLGNWNNHNSVVEFNKQWYVFYHRSTHASNSMRKTCIEPITFDKDGSIKEVEMTSQGAGEPLNALSKIDAERSCLLYGNVRIEASTTYNEVLTQIKKGDKAAYKYINFNEGVDNVMVGVIPGKFKGAIEVVLDNSWGPAIGVVKVDAGEKQVVTLNAAIKKTTGIHAVWLRFNTEAKNADDSFEVDWFKFK